MNQYDNWHFKALLGGSFITVGVMSRLTTFQFINLPTISLKLFSKYQFNMMRLKYVDAQLNTLTYTDRVKVKLEVV